MAEATRSVRRRLSNAPHAHGAAASAPPPQPDPLQLGNPEFTEGRLTAADLAIAPALWMVTAQPSRGASLSVGAFTTDGLYEFLRQEEAGTLSNDLLPRGSQLRIDWTVPNTVRPTNDEWPWTRMTYAFPIADDPFNQREPATLWSTVYDRVLRRMVAGLRPADDIMDRLVAEDRAVRDEIAAHQDEAHRAFLSLPRDLRGVIAGLLPYKKHDSASVGVSLRETYKRRNERRAHY